MPIRPKTVLVIGGGAAGLVSLRNLLELGQFDKVELVERRDDVGGVWYLDDPAHSSNSQQPRWPSPAYPNLIGNVLPEFLSFRNARFPEPPSHPEQPFPTLSETHQYLQNFAKPLKDHIRLNTEVLRVDELEQGWRVTLNDWNTDGTPVVRQELWDAVVVAVCWYDNPVWTSTEGLDELRMKGLAKHAKVWRGPEGFEGKRTLVVGNANSSNDIAAQLAPVAQTPVYRSIRRKAFPGFVSLPDERIEDVPPVQRYTVSSDDVVTAHLTDGRTLEVDFVHVGAGYRPYPSFVHLRTPESPSVSIMSKEISPHRIPDIHRLILHAFNPSLAFIGTVAISYTPFTIADITSTWLALGWSGEIPYPDTPAERLESERERLEQAVKVAEETAKTGDGASSLAIYGVLGASEEPYATGLREDIVKARPKLDSSLPLWTPERKALREGMYPIKRKALEWAREQKTKGLANGDALAH